MKCDHIDRNVQIYDVNKKNFINVEFERSDSFFIQNQCRFIDSLQNREMFNIFWKEVCDVVIDQYVFEFAIVVSWRNEDIINVRYRIRWNNDNIHWNEFVFKCFVFESSIESTTIKNDFVSLSSLMTNSLIEILSNEISKSMFSSSKELNDEILISIISQFSDKLFQTTFKSLTRFSFEITICKALFKIIAFLFRMICRSAVKFITYETLFRDANWKFITRSRVNQKFTIVTIINWFEFAMILFVDKIVIENMITIRDVDVLKIRVILFVDWFVINNIKIKNVDQIWEFRWWVM